MSTWTGTRIVLFTLLVGMLLAGCIVDSGGTESDTIADTAAAPASTATTTEPPASTPVTPPTLTATAPPGPSPTSSPTPTQPPVATPTLSPTSTAIDATPEEERAAGPVIVLKPAHDHLSPGALGIEYELVLMTAEYTRAALEAAGYTVYLTREDNGAVLHDDDPSLRPASADEFRTGYVRAFAYASKALTYDPDLVIVLHYNGLDDPSVGGIEVYYCELGGEQNLTLAEITLDELLAAFESLDYQPPRAVIREDLSVARGDRHFPSLGNVYEYPRTHLENRYAGVPIILTEPLYLTNPAERALIDDPATHEALAAAYVRIADRWFER